MEWTDTALVLRVGRFRESDLWLHLLTRERGVVSAFAFGGSRSRRRFSGCLDLLNVIRVRAKDGRGAGYLNLEEGSLLEGPRRLRQDWRRMGMLMNCVRFLETLGVTHDTTDSAFALTRRMLGVCEQADTVREALPVLFRLRLASDQGYVPDFSTCGRCGEQVYGPGWFALREGVLLCGACALELPPDAQGDDTLLPPQVLGALQAVQNEEPEVWNELDLPPAQWRQCTRLVDGFIQFHLGLAWENGRFRRV